MRKLIFLIIVIALGILLTPPLNLPVGGAVVKIEDGYSVSKVASVLAENHVIRSKIAFIILARLSGVSGSLKAGRYKFSQDQMLWVVLSRVQKGEYGTVARKITIPEGKTNKEISKLVGRDMGTTDQGYLFPDTYYIDELADSFEIHTLMRQNFDKKTDSLDIASSTIALASILEEEVRGEVDMKIVSGILQKRLKAGMLLQVDAYPDSYKVVGLPSEPISNPGLVAIDAALHPTTSKYLFYLTGKDGKTYYAKTFAEHQNNIAKYLR